MTEVFVEQPLASPGSAKYFTTEKPLHVTQQYGYVILQYGHVVYLYGHVAQQYKYVGYVAHRDGFSIYWPNGPQPEVFGYDNPSYR